MVVREDFGNAPGMQRDPYRQSVKLYPSGRSS